MKEKLRASLMTIAGTTWRGSGGGGGGGGGKEGNNVKEETEAAAMLKTNKKVTSVAERHVIACELAVKECNTAPGGMTPADGVLMKSFM
jgi:hypothetical protein